jgi:uncharacterized protein YutE (UPF0331/DUF86 family)
VSPSRRPERGEHRQEVSRAVVEVERQHVRARLRRLVVDTRALKAAVEDEYGPDFDRERWAAVFGSDDPRDVNKVAAVISAYERIVNGLVEAARSGLVASGVAQPVGTPESVRGDLESVRDDGGLTDAQLDLLVELTRTRNALQHVYFDVSADDARDAIRKLRGNLPRLIRALNDWFTRYDVGA